MYPFSRRRDEDDEEDAAPEGPFAHPEPLGSALIVRADHFAAARKIYDAIFGPGTELAEYAEKLRRQKR